MPVLVVLEDTEVSSSVVRRTCAAVRGSVESRCQAPPYPAAMRSAARPRQPVPVRCPGSPGPHGDPLQDLAASGGVLFGQPVEQVEGVVVIEGARSPRPTQGPYPSPLTRSVVVPPGDPDITGQTAKRPRRAWLTRIREAPAVRTTHLLPWYHAERQGKPRTRAGSADMGGSAIAQHERRSRADPADLCLVDCPGDAADPADGRWGFPSGKR